MRKTMKRASGIGCVSGLLVSLAIWAMGAPAQAQTWPQPSQWIPLQKSGLAIGDVRGDATGGQGERDLVGDDANPVSSIYQDATHFFFRLRLDGTPLQNDQYQSFGWGCAIDTDGDFSSFEFLGLVDGIANPDVVQYRWNQTKSGTGDLKDVTEVLVREWSAATHARTSLADTTFGGDPDYFLDWAIPLATMRMPPPASGAPAVSEGAILRFACGTSNNAREISADPSGANGAGVFEDVVGDPVVCGASGCTSCTVASACGSSCMACAGGTPACKATSGTCVRCMGASDCPSGASCSNDQCVVAAPTVTSPSNGSQTNNASPTITGTTMPNALVSVRIDGSEAGTAVSDANGNWQFSVPMALALGSHTVSASATLGAGVLAVSSAPSSQNTFNVISGCLSSADCAGSTPFCNTSTQSCVRCLNNDNCPSGSACSGDQTCVLPAPVVTAPSNGSTLNNATPTVSGTAVANATVNIFVDGASVGSVGSTGAGAFSYTLPLALTPGVHSIVATAQVGAGLLAITSAQSAAVSFTLISGCLNNADCSGSTPVCRVGDHVCVRCVSANDCPSAITCQNNACALTPPAITSPTNAQMLNDATPTVSGTGFVGATLTIWIDGVAAGSTTISAEGSWSIVVASALATGPHQVVAVAQVGQGAQEVSASSQTVAFTLVQGCVSNADCDSASPICEAGSNTCIQCLSSTDCSGALPECEVMDKQCVRCNVDSDCPLGARCVDDACEVPVPTINSPAQGLSTRDRRPEVVGVSVPGALVTLYADGVAVATVIADGAGGFVLEPMTDLALGLRSLQATATVGTGVLAVTSDRTSERNITIVQGCLLDAHCDGATPTCNITTNVCVRCVNNDDCPSGAICQASTCGLAAPVAGLPAQGSSTNNATPTFTGFATPGAFVTVRVDGNVVGNAVVDANGSWQLIAPVALAVGAHQYTLQATVGSGALAVQSETTSSITFNIVGGCTVDGDCPSVRFCDAANAGICVRCLMTSQCPEGATCTNAACVLAAPALTLPSEGTTTNARRPVFTGTAVPGAVVNVNVDGLVVLVATADSQGNWQVAPAADLPLGDHSAVVTAQVGTGAAAVSSNSAPAVSFVIVAGCVTSMDCAGSTPVCTPTSGACVRCLQTSQCPTGATCVMDSCRLPAPTITSPTAGGVISDGNVVVSGLAAPGATVTIIIDNQPVGSVVSGGQGMFAFALPMALAPGGHTLVVTATAGEGAAAVMSGASAPVQILVSDTGMDAGVADGGVATDAGGSDALATDAAGEPSADGSMGMPMPPVVPPGMVCTTDSDCGTLQSGVLCDGRTGTCAPGCRAQGGNMCPVAVVCTSLGTEVGQCDYGKRYRIAGGGCQVGAGSQGGWATLALCALAWAFALRRRRRTAGR